MVDIFGFSAFRMPAGFAGEVNRTHPVTIEPVFNDPTVPVLQPGLAAVINSAKNGVRSIAAGDTGIATIYGIAVRSFPIQQSDSLGMTANFGTYTLPKAAAIDVIRSGYILAPVVGAPAKNDPCFLWCAASTGAHVQGGFEASSSGGNTAALTTCFFNGAPDASGIGEIMFAGGL